MGCGDAMHRVPTMDISRWSPDQQVGYRDTMHCVSAHDTVFFIHQPVHKCAFYGYFSFWYSPA